MSEIETRKVVQSNDLITSVAKIDAVPLKIFELAVSLINPLEPPKNNIVNLSKNELFDFFKVSSENKYTRFREAIKKLQENSIIQVSYEDKNKGFKYKSIVPIPYVEWTDYDDNVQIRFDQEIIPYLINLKDNFTQYLITDIGNLNSKHSIVLYKWLTMNYNLYKKYGNSKNKEPLIELKELRQLTDTEKEYDRFFYFERWVIKESVEEINLHTHYVITYRKIKKGRSVSEIQFIIDESTRRMQGYQIDKQERYSDNYDNNKQRIEELSVDHLKALNSPYIAHLIESGLVHYADTENIVKLYRKVVPMYEKMLNFKHSVYAPYETFYNHIGYVKNKMVDTPSKFANISEYLKVAAKDYLSKLERQIDENN